MNKVYQQHQRVASASPPSQPSPGTTASVTSPISVHLGGNGNLDLDTSLDVDDDLLDDLGGGVEATQVHNGQHFRWSGKVWNSVGMGVL